MALLEPSRTCKLPEASFTGGADPGRLRGSETLFLTSFQKCHDARQQACDPGACDPSHGDLMTTTAQAQGDRVVRLFCRRRDQDAWLSGGQTLQSQVGFSRRQHATLTWSGCKFHHWLNISSQVHFRGKRVRDTALSFWRRQLCSQQRHNHLLPQCLLPPQASPGNCDDTEGPLRFHATNKYLSIFNLGSALSDGVGTSR